MIITCPSCGTLGRAACETFATVTCPRAACAQRFLAWPPGTQVDAAAELRERRFVCAVTDRPFWVVLGRRAEAERFQVMKVRGQTGWLQTALEERQRSELARLGDQSSRVGDNSRALARTGGTLPAVAADAGPKRNLLGAFFAPSPLPAPSGLADVHWVRPTAEQVIAVLAPRVLDADTLDFADVDLDGWHCIHCGIEHEDRGGFIHCTPRCKELVCSGRSELRRGGIYFRCRASCGCEGMTAPAPIAVGGSRYRVPQASGREGLIGGPRQTLIGREQPRRLR